MSDLISRAEAIEAVRYAEHRFTVADEQHGMGTVKWDMYGVYTAEAVEAINALPSADAVHGEWIPCSDRLPSEDEIVNITWVNHNPPPYYTDIAEKPFVASGLRYRGKWYWYSSVCQDLHQDFDIIDKDIEVIAWQPLPTPYKGGDTE